MNSPKAVDFIREKFGIKINDKSVDESEMAPEIEALLREFGLLDETDSSEKDAEAQSPVAE